MKFQGINSSADQSRKNLASSAIDINVLKTKVVQLFMNIPFILFLFQKLVSYYHVYCFESGVNNFNTKTGLCIFLILVLPFRL